jgi:hypothetical protein
VGHEFVVLFAEIRVVSERKCEPVDACERGTKLMGQIGDEVVPRLSEFTLAFESLFKAASALATSGTASVRDDQDEWDEREDQESDGVGNSTEAPAGEVDSLNVVVANVGELADEVLIGLGLLSGGAGCVFEIAGN